MGKPPSNKVTILLHEPPLKEKPLFFASGIMYVSREKVRNNLLH
jgi:hypothetical protein